MKYKICQYRQSWFYIKIKYGRRIFWEKAYQSTGHGAEEFRFRSYNEAEVKAKEICRNEQDYLRQKDRNFCIPYDREKEKQRSKEIDEKLRNLPKDKCPFNSFQDCIGSQCAIWADGQCSRCKETYHYPMSVMY